MSPDDKLLWQIRSEDKLHLPAAVLHYVPTAATQHKHSGKAEPMCTAVVKTNTHVRLLLIHCSKCQLQPLTCNVAQLNSVLSTLICGAAVQHMLPAASIQCFEEQ